MQVIWPEDYSQCFNLHANSTQGEWWQSMWFPLLAGGYYQEYPSAQIAMIVFSSINLLLVLSFLFGRFFITNVPVFPTYIMFLWQLLIHLGQLIISSSGFNSASASILYFDFLIEVIMMALFINLILKRPVTKHVYVIFTLIFFLVIAYVSTNQVLIQQYFSLMAWVPDAVNPVLSCYLHLWPFCMMTSVHWLSFYPTWEWCIHMHAVVIWQVVWQVITMICLVYQLYTFWTNRQQVDVEIQTI